VAREYLSGQLPYSGKFSHGAKFRVFRGQARCRENKNCEILNGRRKRVMSYMQSIGMGVVLAWRRREN
jgi:hypothetical protein